MNDINDYEFPDDPDESPELSTINQIQLPNGSIYGFEDTFARDEVTDITSDINDLEERVNSLNHSLANFADKPYYKLIGQTAAHNKVGHFNFNDASRSLYKIKNFYAASGEGDYFYLAHKKSDYTITATKHFSNTADLFTADLSSDCTIATNLISESDPAILTIVRKHEIDTDKTADNLTLIFYEDMGRQSNARLKHWKLEIMKFTGKDWEWLTVFERTNVSDSINCLWCGLNPNDNWAYLRITGIRITIYAATPYSTHSWEFGYNQLKIAGMRLLESRPSFSPAEALGALDVAGGTVYGETEFQEGISATSYSGATATSSADGLMSKADKAKLDTLDNNYYTKNPQNLPSGFNSTDRASMNHLKNGWYWHFGDDGTLNFPSDWGFMIKFGFENDGDFSALYFTQMTGTIYRCSGNANGISGWVAI